MHALAMWHYDGVTAMRRTGTLRVEGDFFFLHDDDWSSGPHAFADLERSSTTAPPVYTLKGVRGWRLGLAEAPGPDLAARLPDARRYGGLIDRFGLGRSAAAFGVVAVLVVAAVLSSPPLIARLVPLSYERRLGELMVGDLGGRFCNAPGGQAALDRIADRLGLDADTADLHVAAIPVSNAVTLPGGKIIIFAGLLNDAQSPDEIAGVVGHEVGHVVHRDVMTTLIRQLGLTALLGGVQGNVGQYGNVLLSASYSRAAEADADRYSIDLMNARHISPAFTGGFFARLSRGIPGGNSAERAMSYLSSHPVTAQRAKRFFAASRGRRDYRPVLNPAEWQALRQICANRPPSAKLPLGF